MRDLGQSTETATSVPLPLPSLSGSVSLEAAVYSRRSRRDFAEKALTLAQAGQILWATQGITEPRQGRRAAPSAGARYPLELTLAAGRVDGLVPGLYHYQPADHTLETVRLGDARLALARSAADQIWMADAALILVVSAVFERTTARYGTRGRRYVHFDAGLAVENACLQVAALGLAAVVVGAFDDPAVADLLALSGEEEPLLLLPVGWPV
ncbi:MAG: SagB/ThcOx family dehydrogenase [Candidatus Promineifilaceae bacterium]|nr:SagB/ThcOx family dehydrogenase [Candidatus Promineifilaceae bacterium]